MYIYIHIHVSLERHVRLLDVVKSYKDCKRDIIYHRLSWNMLYL
jgi:hypothetical protein